MIDSCLEIRKLFEGGFFWGEGYEKCMDEPLISFIFLLRDVSFSLMQQRGHD